MNQSLSGWVGFLLCKSQIHRLINLNREVYATKFDATKIYETKIEEIFNKSHLF